MKRSTLRVLLSRRGLWARPDPSGPVRLATGRAGLAPRPSHAAGLAARPVLRPTWTGWDGTGPQDHQELNYGGTSP